MFACGEVGVCTHSLESVVEDGFNDISGALLMRCDPWVYEYAHTRLLPPHCHPPHLLQDRLVLVVFLFPLWSLARGLLRRPRTRDR